jgi:3-oxoisoapionate decarboxylase
VIGRREVLASGRVERMKVGISSWAYPWAVGVPGCPPEQPMTAFDLVDRAHDHGVGLVQIADNLPLHLLDDGDLDRLAQRARERDIDIEVGTAGIGSDHLRRYVEIAAHLSSRILRVVMDTPEHQPQHEEIVTTFRSLQEDLERWRVHLLIENHDRFPAVELRRVLEDVDSPWLGICLDTVNSLGCLEVVETVLEVLRPWVRNVHLKDFVIERVENRMGFAVSGAPVGRGHLDVAGLLDQLRGVTNDVTIVLELWPSAEPSLEATIAKEHGWVEQSIEYLRSIMR